MATRIETLTVSKNSTRQLIRELWHMFLFYLRILVVTVLFAAIVLYFYSAFESV
jgi:hypothetical protein